MAQRSLVVEVGPPARSIREFFLENRDVRTSMKWTGTKWKATFKDYDLAKAGDYLDIEIGVTGVDDKCGFTVTYTGKKPKKFSRKFSPSGRIFFTASIKKDSWKDA